MIDETQEYLHQLQNLCLEAIRKQNLQVWEFFYTSIFNEQYYKLDHTEDLQYEIGRKLLYPFRNQPEFPNTLSAVTLIPAFMYYVKGMDLKQINKIIKTDPENRWEVLLTAFGHRIDNEHERYEENLQQFNFNLQRESQQSIGIDLGSAKSYIENQIAPQTILKQLYNFFLEDAQKLLQAQETQNYQAFLTKQKRQIIMNIYQSLQQSQDLERNFEYNKMRIAMAFLTHDYETRFVNRYFDHMEAGLLIFSLIQLDKKQFQVFFCQLTIGQQEQLVNRVIAIVDTDESAFYKLLLVGRTLFQLRQWKNSQRIFEILIKKINNYPRKRKYQMYIEYNMCKILLVTGQVNGLAKKYKHLSERIVEQGQVYQGKRSIYHQCLFFQLLLSAYENRKDYLKSVLIIISKFNIYAKGFTFLQTSLIKVLQITGIVFQDKRGEQQLNQILRELQVLGNQNNKINIFAAAEELLILNVLLQHKDIYVLQYLNPNYSSVVKKMINNYQASTQAQIYFFFYEFDSALNLATGLKDFRLIAQIYEQREQYDRAINFYSQAFSPNSQFNCAVILRIKQQHTDAYNGFQRLEVQSHFKYISQKYKDVLRNQLNLQDLEEGIYLNNRRLQTLQNNMQSRISSIASEQVRNYSFYTESIYTGSFFDNSGLARSFDKSTAKQSMAQNNEQNQIDCEMREDVQFFYQHLKDDLANKSRSLLAALNEFLNKINIYKVESNKLFANNDNLQEVIGKGGQSVVFKFEYQGLKYAAKLIEIQYDEDPEKITVSDLKLIENKLKEINILCAVSQSNIKYVLQLRHIGFKFSMKGQFKSFKIYLLTDLHKPSSLLKDQGLDFKTKFLFKLALTLFTLQNQLQILHLDLKPGNVLMNSKNGNPVLIDFGLSKLFTHSISQYLGEQQMTFGYADPELEQRSRKNDVYSFGVTVYQFITGEVPFKNFNNFSMIMGENRFAECHQEQINGIQNHFFRNLILDCTKSLKDRISFFEVVHKFFQYLYQNQLVDLLFNHLPNLENNKLCPSIWILKQFFERLSRFKPSLGGENTDVLAYEYKYERNILEIVQKISQISNWIKLSSLEGVQKLLDIQITVNESTIQFKFFAEQIQPITIQANESRSCFLKIAKALQEIHSQNICLWNFSKDYCYEKNGKIKIQYYQLSEFVNSSMNPEIYYDYVLNQLDFQSDVKALTQLISDTMLKQSQNQNQDDLVNIIESGYNLTLDQLIQKLQQ